MDSCLFTTFKIKGSKMTEPFLAEIRIFSFNFPPRGWAACNGQILPINQNQALFSLLGTTYGGDGRVNFALPDLRGRTPIHEGNSHTLGERSGAISHTLSINELPQHNHTLQANNNSANTNQFSQTTLPARSTRNTYNNSPTGLVNFNTNSGLPVGGSQAHNNMQPYLTLNFGIALQGIFPSQN